MIAWLSAAALAVTGVEERVGARLPLDLALVDQDGRPVRLGSAFDGVDPVVVVPAYYRCPKLCGLVIAGLAAAEASLGEPVRTVAVSFDPADTPASASAARETALTLLDRPDRWPFLLGGEASGALLLAALGIAVEPTPDGGFAHPAVIAVATPEGRISRYLYGTSPSPDQLRAALSGASEVAPSRAARLLQICTGWDLAAHPGGARFFALVRAGAVAAIGAVAGIVAWSARSSR